MLVEHVFEPIGREVGHFLGSTGGGVSSAWEGYTRAEPLVALTRTSDDSVEFARSANGEARLQIWNIHEVDPDPDSIVFHNALVLESERKATVLVSIDNRQGSSPSEPYIWTREFKIGESEAAAVEAGFSLESTTTIEAGGEAAQFKVSQEFKSVVSSAWSRETGKSREQTVGGTFQLVAPARKYIEGHLEWDEQTQQRRIECVGTYDFGLTIGRRSKGRWSSGSPMGWDSINHLIAVAEQRGSVHHAHYGHYARRRADSEAVRRLQAIREQRIDRLTPPYKGADNIRVVIDREIS